LPSDVVITGRKRTARNPQVDARKHIETTRQYVTDHTFRGCTNPKAAG
jgi:hypothetical protein